MRSSPSSPTSSLKWIGTVFAQEHADYIVIKVEGPFKVGHHVDMRVEMQPIFTNSSQMELVQGARRMLEKFLGTVSSWTKRL